MHILAVDDNITIRQLISMTIKKTSDIRVSLAQSGQEALDMARVTPFDMFLIDWSMHPMDGEKLLETIRRLPLHKKTPIIVLSANSNEDDKYKAEALGANAWIVKPFHPIRLIEIIRDMVKEPNFIK